MKKILILTGSPRKDGNTMYMVREFIRGAQEAGHEVTEFDTAFMDLGGCRHCQTCWSKGRSCSLDDDFVKIGPVLEEADVLIFAAPVYWGTFPSHLKAMIDKLYAYVVPSCQKSLQGKKFGIITCGDGEDEHAFDGVVSWYKGIAAYMKWEDAGWVGVPQMWNKGDVTGTDAPTRAYEMGRTI